MVKLVQLNFSLIINRAYVPVVIQFQREKDPGCQSALFILCVSVSVSQYKGMYVQRERERERVTETQTCSDRERRSERETDRR